MKNLFRLLSLLAVMQFPMMCVPVLVPAQTDAQLSAIMTLAGASSEEELDENEIERYVRFISHPLEINLSNRSKLLSSGLLSRYQAASLEDYRSRNGDVLSFTELALIEGFGKDFADALRPFVTLKSRSAPGELPDDSLRVHQDILVRAGVRTGEYNYGAKYRMYVGDICEYGIAGRTAYSDKRQFPPSTWSFSGVWYGQKRPWRVVAGDYNLKIGQGLSLWSGLSLSGFSSSSSFYKRPTGLSPSFSWSGNGTHRGIASDFQAGRFLFTSFVSFPGLRSRWEGKDSAVEFLPGANVGYFARNGQLSLTVFGNGKSGKVSGDFRWNWKGMDYFGEVAADLKGQGVAFLAGSVLPLGRDWKLSWQARSTDRKGVAAGLENHGFQLTGDYSTQNWKSSVRQYKIFMKLPLQLGRSSVLSLRFTERIRPYEEILKYRTGARVDLDYSSAGLSARYGESEGDSWKWKVGIEGLLCRSLAGLSYIECGRKTERYSAYLRGTFFMIDNWDDRIYSYERDAPGSFNVPAYYGRGYSLSAVGGSRFRFGTRKAKTLKVYFRVSTTRYPFMEKPKPSRTEARLQLMASL